MLSSLKLMLESFHVKPHNNVPESDDLSDNLMLNICKKCIHTTEKLHDENFFIQETVVVDPERNIVTSRNVATPLFACLMCIELSDLVRLQFVCTVCMYVCTVCMKVSNVFDAEYTLVVIVFLFLSVYIHWY